MNPLQVGALVCQQYRIDRLSHERDGVLAYEATDTVSGVAVIVKIIRREGLEDADVFARFQAGAHDPSIVAFGSASGLPFYVTELSIELTLDDDDDDITLERHTRAAIACTTSAAT